YYNRYRYYDPEAGRYISQDPAGGPPHLNLFSYVDNPTYQTDDLGLTHYADAYFQPAGSNTPAQRVSPQSGGSNGSYDSTLDAQARADAEGRRQSGLTGDNYSHYTDHNTPGGKPGYAATERNNSQLAGCVNGVESFTHTEAKILRDLESDPENKKKLAGG